MRKLLMGLCALALVTPGALLLASPVMAAGKGQPSVLICHHDIDDDTGLPTVEIIKVSNQAVDKHLSKHPGDYHVAVDLCDGVDNDCDGSVDEDYEDLGTACSAGVGACEVQGEYVCTDDQTGTECDATAGTPTAEVCDGIDNNCDGYVDEGVCGIDQCGPIVCCPGEDCEEPGLCCDGEVCYETSCEDGPVGPD